MIPFPFSTHDKFKALSPLTEADPERAHDEGEGEQQPEAPQHEVDAELEQHCHAGVLLVDALAVAGGAAEERGLLAVGEAHGVQGVAGGVVVEHHAAAQVVLESKICGGFELSKF